MNPSYTTRTGGHQHSQAPEPALMPLLHPSSTEGFPVPGVPVADWGNWGVHLQNTDSSVSMSLVLMPSKRSEANSECHLSVVPCNPSVCVSVSQLQYRGQCNAWRNRATSRSRSHVSALPEHPSSIPAGATGSASGWMRASPQASHRLFCCWNQAAIHIPFRDGTNQRSSRGHMGNSGMKSQSLHLEMRAKGSER